jgi:organic radical activating enzyme
MDLSNLTRVENTAEIFHLTWVINNICTQHCDYCPSLLNAGKNHHYNWADAKRFAEKIISQHSKIKLIIAGGEPTVCPWFKPLVNLFIDQGHCVSVSTNGVRNGSYWDDCPLTDITVSYHPQYHDDQWIERVVETQQRIPDIMTRVMMDSRHWDRCLDMHQRLSAVPELGVEVAKLVDWGALLIPYTEEQLAWMAATKHRNPKAQKSIKFMRDWHLSKIYNSQGTRLAALEYWPNHLINQGLNKFSRWQCNIGLESLFVQFDGSVRRGNCEQGGYIGRLQEDFQLPTAPIICKQTLCKCDTDMLISKTNIF